MLQGDDEKNAINAQHFHLECKNGTKYFMKLHKKIPIKMMCFYFP